MVTFDASLTGGGATLSMGNHDDRTVVSFWRTRCTKEDASAPDANFQDPAHQAAWEAYAMLVALTTWGDLFKDPCTVTLRGDAQGVLQGIIKGQARSAAINLIFAEVQLVLAPLALDLTAIHWWSEHNALCDQISRPDVDREVPGDLKGVQEVAPEGVNGTSSDKISASSWVTRRSERGNKEKTFSQQDIL